MDSLSPEDQVCWAFQIKPSEYLNLAYTTIWYDVTYQIRVRIGELSVNHLQQHYTMVKILSQAFGSEKSDETPYASTGDAVSKMNKMFEAK